MITLLYNRKKYPDIIAELRKEEFLGNLTNLCKYTLITAEKEDKKNGQKWKNCVVKNPYSFVGIELELLGFNDDDFGYEANEKVAWGWSILTVRPLKKRKIASVTVTSVTVS